MSAPDPVSPFDLPSRTGRFGAPGEAPVAISERRGVFAQVIASRGKEEDVHATVRSALGLELPQSGHTATTDADTAVWIAPLAWLVMRSGSVDDGLVSELASELRASAAVVDQTCGKTVLRLSGARARDVLAKGCRIDLHTRVFGPGRAAVTPLFHIHAILMQVDTTPTFDLVVPSTLAADFLERLCLAAAEFGGEIKA